ncbi:hypothetical protein [Sinisalibacter lacisalsi]|uniref:Uncharacterized protein n=1 Tax=Sinisalibacter lacisalsi TaxID=1526570 RepID=A0ABQ1QPI5_9RHOB|nr:hypothetical protein [Sinisalibacter lacisalsi]GGD36375.1 hypothetical protein GCM10011358_20240 [Sinisalibacter lacisalsi]
MRAPFHLLLLAMLAVMPAQARAHDCGFYTECCHALVEAYREAGVSGPRLEQFAATCELHHVFDAMPGAQAMFCAEAWEAISVVAYRHYVTGRIGFYPEMCMADPDYDAGEILEPDPMFPEPDHERFLEEMDPWFPG